MRRARYIKDPATVLRMLLMHVGSGCSLAETAARCKAAGLAQISAVGVSKRLRSAEPWFRWLAQQMRGAGTLRMPLVGRRLRAVDATSVHEPGATGTDWKLHYCVNLADLHCDFFQLTDIREGGETFRRVPVATGDILMGDRVYASPPGISHVVNRGGDVIARWNRGTLPVYEPGGQRLELLPRLRQLGDKPQEYETRIKDPRGGWIRGRLLALRQSVEAARWAQKRMQRRAQRSQETVSTEALEFAEYFTIWSTLPAGVARTAQILEFYRLRWQIELVFKRMKSILGFGHLPKKSAPSAQAWLEGKLFVGLLIERMIHTAEAISPWGYTLAATPKSLARD